MGFTDDWIMRQIEVVSRYVAKLMFGKPEVGYSLPASDMLSATDQLYLELGRLLREKRI